MASRMRQAIERHARRQEDAAGEAVTYIRGADRIDLTAVVGTTPFRQTLGGHSTLDWAEADFLIRASELKIGGDLIEPARTDRIEWDGDTYEILAPGGEPDARASDRYGIRWRIHGKKIEPAA